MDISDVWGKTDAGSIAVAAHGRAAADSAFRN